MVALVEAFIKAATKEFHDKLTRTLVNTPQGRMTMHAKGIPIFYMNSKFAQNSRQYLALAKEVLQ